MPVLCAGALLGAAIAGCGGDDDGDSTAKQPIEFAASNEPEEVFIKRMAKLLETTTAKKDCAQLEAINARSFTRFRCPPAKSLRRSMARFEVVGQQDYGTGAVIDYRSGEVRDGAAILLYVAPDRNWGVARFGLVTEPSTETDDEDSRDGYEQAVDDYLAGARARDCAALKKVAFLGATKPKDVCKTVLAQTAELAKRLKANPTAKPVYQGGNATYGFFGLETAKPQPANSTISVVRDPDEESPTPYVVMDVAPSPTAAEQRRVQEQFRRQQRARTATDPSSKPSDPAVKP